MCRSRIFFSLYLQAMFLAHGPGFKQNYSSQPFENIELYNLMSGMFLFTFSYVVL